MPSVFVLSIRNVCCSLRETGNQVSNESNEEELGEVHYNRLSYCSQSNEQSILRYVVYLRIVHILCLSCLAHMANLYFLGRGLQGVECHGAKPLRFAGGRGGISNEGRGEVSQSSREGSSQGTESKTW